MTIPLNIGFCGVCETPIFDKVNGRLIPNNNYAEIHFALSNETTTSHAVCKSCASNMTGKKLTDLLERIKETWYIELNGRANQEELAKIKGLTYLVFNSNPTKLDQELKDKLVQIQQSILKKGNNVA